MTGPVDSGRALAAAMYRRSDIAMTGCVQARPEKSTAGFHFRNWPLIGQPFQPCLSNWVSPR
jgi:hypothetical protein